MVEGNNSNLLYSKMAKPHGVCNRQLHELSRCIYICAPCDLNGKLAHTVLSFGGWPVLEA